MSVVLVICAMAIALAQAPARDARADVPAPAGTAAISGTVVTATSVARPVRLAYVVLIGATTGALRVTSSDERGRFSFTGLPADRYVVGASKAPYLGSVAGAKRPARTGTPIVLKEGEGIADVTIRMPLGASVSGVITDERVQPAAGVLVGLQQRRMQAGERVWVSVSGSNTATDEYGRYRLHSLPPGEYAVVAMRAGGPTPRTLTDAEVDAALKGNRMAPASPADPTSAPAPVYFPGTTRASDATPITLAAAEERGNVDFRLETVRTASVEGTVSTADGQPPLPNVFVSFVTTSASNPLQRGGGARVMPDGTFKIANATPGSYTLTAQETGPQGRFASTIVDVAGVDQTGIQLMLRPPLALSARLVFEGASTAPQVAGRRVPFRSLAPVNGVGTVPQVGATTAAGAFSITGVLPGQYMVGGPLFFGATNDSVTWTLQSVVADGREITDLPLTVTADAVPRDIVVTYGDRWQDLSGQLRQANAAATEYTLIVFPAEKKYWLPGSRRILTARPDTAGQFRMGGPGPTSLPAGAYLLAAATDIERDEQFDPAFLEALVPSAIPVTVQSGERKVQDVVIK